MNDPILYYQWNGQPIAVDVYDGEKGAWDVSTMTSPAEHATGTVPEGETHYLCRLIGSRHDGWWATEESFVENAEPIGPGAVEYEEGRQR